MDISLPAVSSTAYSIAVAAERPPLWNPRAATLWGLLLSPAFSAYIHMRNWRALGQEDKAAEARTWCYMVMGCIVVSCFLPVAGEMLGRDLSPPSATALGLLAAWHLWGGRAQERYVAAVIGDSYVRRPWSKSVFSAIGVFTAIVVASALLTVILLP
ncbi:hypothetical protein [Massilia sp. HP4]|uniref:hypothetical protein n=1 Tax=Massilia sp. HP4 TaxID=2562316 RepID=UPI0010C156F2|nr:hypothetical protein [Massilia sp. HP4]